MEEEKTNGDFDDSKRAVAVSDEAVRCGADAESPDGNGGGYSSDAVEIAAINASVKKLRTLCGCLIFLLIIAVSAAVCPIYLLVSETRKTAEIAANAVSSTLKNAMSAVIAVANSQPSSNVVMSSEYMGTVSENKFVVASVDEKVNMSAEFAKLKFLTASIKIGVLAHYQYYIPLRGWKFDVEKSPSSDKCDFTFYFDTLALDTPVKFDEIYREIDKSKFSADANKMLAEFQRKEFPNTLVEKGKGVGNMMLASDKARKAAESFVRAHFFSRDDIESKVGKINIVFDTNTFDNFRTRIQISANESRK